jgi:hypothetical protein
VPIDAREALSTEALDRNEHQLSLEAMNAQAASTAGSSDREDIEYKVPFSQYVTVASETRTRHATAGPTVLGSVPPWASRWSRMAEARSCGTSSHLRPIAMVIQE